MNAVRNTASPDTGHWPLNNFIGESDRMPCQTPHSIEKSLNDCCVPRCTVPSTRVKQDCAFYIFQIPKLIHSELSGFKPLDM